MHHTTLYTRMWTPDAERNNWGVYDRFCSLSSAYLRQSCVVMAAGCNNGGLKNVYCGTAKAATLCMLPSCPIP